MIAILSAIFRLKKNYKKLSNEEYASNLSAFLDSARCCNAVSDDDFRSALTGIVQRSIPFKDPRGNGVKDQPSTSQNVIGNLLAIGEHVIIYFAEDGDIDWHLRVVEQGSSSLFSISLLVPVDLSKKYGSIPTFSE